MLRVLFGIDTRSLAVFRVLLGSLLVADLCKRARSLTAHYTDAGVLPRSEIADLGAPPSFAFFHMLGGSPGFEAALFAVAAVLAALLIAGWRTRAVTVASFFLLMSLQQRNWLVIHAGDELLRFLVFWGMFLPLEERWSLDARRRRTPPRAVVCSVGSAALLLQTLLLYVVATHSKLQYDAWIDGRALAVVLEKASYAKPLGTWMLQHPELLRLATWGSVGFEGLAPVLLFVPWRTGPLRTVVVLAFVYFQTGIWLMLSIGLFQPIAMVAVVPFLPPWFWERLSERLGRPIGGAAREDSAPGGPFHRAAQAVCALALAYVVASNALHTSREIRHFPEPLRTVGATFLLDQRWHMFANADATLHGWFAVVGILEDGRPVDVVHHSARVSLERPELYALSFPNHNWRIYWSRIASERYAGFRPYLADYFCREWNGSSGDGMRIRELEILHVGDTRDGGAPARDPHPALLIRRRCAGAES